MTTLKLTKQQKQVLISLATTGQARSRRAGLVLHHLQAKGLVYTVWPEDGEEGFGRPALTYEGHVVAEALTKP